MKCLSERTLA